MDHYPAPQIIRADAAALPLADNSADLVCTSPPYWGLRSYEDGGQHYDGQLGAEPSYREYLDHLIDCTREMVRVVKPSGSLWINLGDKYSNNDGSGPRRTLHSAHTAMWEERRKFRSDIPAKSLVGLPWRYALRCIDELGLILRAEVIWSKPNGLPESVTDRVRRSHEQWFHFTLSPRYFSAVDEIRPVPAGAPDVLGSLPRSVWEIPSQPLHVPADVSVRHFAAFPMEFPRRIVRGWSPREVCAECGAGRRPVSRADRSGVDYATASARAAQRVRASGGALSGGMRRSTLAGSVTRTVVDYACDCRYPEAPTTPGVVLDPFGGTGTTALVAAMHGRQGISVDASADYGRIAEWRCADPRERARAAGADAQQVRHELPGQTSLLDLQP